MKIGITYRLFLSILSATGFAILSLFLIMQWSIDRGFYQYLGKMDQNRLEQALSDLGRIYDEHRSWDFLKTAPPRWDIGGLKTLPENEALRAPMGEQEKDGRGRLPPMPPSFDGRRDGGPLIILNAEKKTVLGSLPKGEKVNFDPITVRGEIVGYVGLISPKHFLHPMQVQFLSQQKLALAMTAAGMVIIVVIISLPLANRLIRPIKAIAAATHHIASGRYATRIPVSSSDELGQLAHDFNGMAQTLEKHEKARRQWVADISHELRTPIAVLRGEIEALIDGIRSVTPETIRSLHVETLRLNHLVEDLYQLSLSDIGALTYRKEDLDLVKMLRDMMESYRAEFGRKGITIVSNLPQEREAHVSADRERLNQLFANLFENSLRYTNAGGNLVIGLAINDRIATIEFQDSAPGVSDHDLSRLFERLYRVEGSRSRTSGGAGLGLAICNNIVEAHGGSISAHQSPLGGLLIRFNLPVAGGARD
ncbi:MAG: ATP-binding protein [Syntrophales bacterium]|nr:ATP-binding protein [Syntrophales bacterium]